MRPELAQVIAECSSLADRDYGERGLTEEHAAGVLLTAMGALSSAFSIDDDEKATQNLIDVAASLLRLAAWLRVHEEVQPT